MDKKKSEDTDPNAFFKFSFPIVLIVVLIFFILVITVSSFGLKSKFDNYNRPPPKDSPETNTASGENTFYTDYINLQDITRPSKKINPEWTSRCYRITENKIALNARKILRIKNSSFTDSFLYDEDYYRAPQGSVNSSYFNASYYSLEEKIYDSEMVDTNLFLQNSNGDGSTNLSIIQHGIITTSTLLTYNDTPNASDKGSLPKSYNISVNVTDTTVAGNKLLGLTTGAPKTMLSGDFIKNNKDASIEAVNIYTITYDVISQTLIFSGTGTHTNIYGNELTEPNYYLYESRQTSNIYRDTSTNITSLNSEGIGYLYFRSSCCDQKLIIKEKTFPTNGSGNFGIKAYYQGNASNLSDLFYFADLKSAQLTGGNMDDVGDSTKNTTNHAFYIIDGSDQSSSTISSNKKNYSIDSDFKEYISLYPFIQTVDANILPRLYSQQANESNNTFSTVTSKDTAEDLQDPTILYIYNFSEIEDAAMFINTELNFIKSGSQQFVIFERSFDGGSTFVNRFYPYSTFGLYKKTVGSTTTYFLRFVLMQTTYLIPKFLNS